MMTKFWSCTCTDRPCKLLLQSLATETGFHEFAPSARRCGEKRLRHSVRILGILLVSILGLAWWQVSQRAPSDRSNTATHQQVAGSDWKVTTDEAEAIARSAGLARIEAKEALPPGPQSRLIFYGQDDADRPLSVWIDPAGKVAWKAYLDESGPLPVLKAKLEARGLTVSRFRVAYRPCGAERCDERLQAYTEDQNGEALVLQFNLKTGEELLNHPL